MSNKTCLVCSTRSGTPLPCSHVLCNVCSEGKCPACTPTLTPVFNSSYSNNSFNVSTPLTARVGLVGASCIRCKESFVRQHVPRLLECGHSMCTDCVKAESEAKGANQLVCPMCLNTTIILNGATSLPVNEPLLELINHITYVVDSSPGVPDLPERPFRTYSAGSLIMSGRSGSSKNRVAALKFSRSLSQSPRRDPSLTAGDSFRNVTARISSPIERICRESILALESVGTPTRTPRSQRLINMADSAYSPQAMDCSNLTNSPLKDSILSSPNTQRKRLFDTPCSCDLCSQAYSDQVVPRLLRCFHTFCQTCLAKAIDFDGPEEVVVCPACGDATKLGESGIRGLLRNYALETVSILPKHTPDDVPKNLSDLAERRGATCPVCLENYLHRAPRLLKCGHTICSCCLRTLWRGLPFITCPNCRSRMRLNSQGLKGVPLNHALHTLLKEWRVVLGDASVSSFVSEGDDEDVDQNSPSNPPGYAWGQSITEAEGIASLPTEPTPSRNTNSSFRSVRVILLFFALLVCMVCIVLFVVAALKD